MQPEQQNQTSPPGSNIPDYLGMKPVSDQNMMQAKKRRIKSTILVAVLFSVITVVGGVVFLWVQGEPQRQLYSVLDVLMQTSYSTRTMDFSDSNKNTIKATLDSDYTTPGQPISELDYMLNITNSSKEKSTIDEEGSLVVGGADSIMIRVVSSSDESVKTDEWLNKSNVELSTPGNTIGMMYSLIMQPYLIPIGDLNANVRMRLLDAIKSNEIYAVTSSSIKQKNNTTYRVLEVDINYSKFGDLVMLINKLTDADWQRPAAYSMGKAQFWIDEASNRIVAISEERQFAKGYPKEKLETTIDYPKELTVELPSKG